MEKIWQAFGTNHSLHKESYNYKNIGVFALIINVVFAIVTIVGYPGLPEWLSFFCALCCCSHHTKQPSCLCLAFFIIILVL